MEATDEGHVLSGRGPKLAVFDGGEDSPEGVGGLVQGMAGGSGHTTIVDSGDGERGDWGWVSDMGRRGVSGGERNTASAGQPGYFPHCLDLGQPKAVGADTGRSPERQVP
jgi:hypothetical protein